ncbi:MAG: IclR family transcriptional regulator [Sterolibacterium sp.]
MKKPLKATNEVERDAPGPRSLTRLLALFDVLSREPNKMSLAELNIAVNTPKSSLLNLLRPLVADGYLLHVNGDYQLGPSMFRLAAGVLAAWNFPKLIHPFMLELSHRTEETVLLSILDREAESVTYVDIVNSPHPVRYQIPVGTTKPLYASTGGRLLLAYSDKKWQDKYLASVTFKVKTAIPMTRQFLKRDILQTRAEGLSCSLDSSLKGLSGVSAPIFGVDGKCVAALSIAGPTERFRRDLESLKAAVRDVAERASGITVEPGS